MKVIEFGEQCEYEGVFWSQIAVCNDKTFEIIKTALIAKFEKNILLSSEALDEGEEDKDYIDALIDMKTYNARRLNQVKKAQFIDELIKVDAVFVRESEVVENVGGDYWSQQASKDLESIANA